MSIYSKLILDLDGTLYRGRNAIPGAIEAVQQLRKSCSILFLSNNGNHNTSRLGRRLLGLGFDVGPGEVVCSLDLIVVAVNELGAGLRILTLSTGDLDGALEESGHRIVRNAPADVVIAGVDWEFTYQRLTCALRALRGGAVLIGANADATYPTEEGPRPAAGVFVGAMRGMGFEPVRLCGKPDPWAMREAFRIRRFTADADCLLVGDRIDSDIHGAQAIGIDSALVLTGVTARAELEAAEAPPTYVLESIADLPNLLARRGALGESQTASTKRDSEVA